MKIRPLILLFLSASLSSPTFSKEPTLLEKRKGHRTELIKTQQDPGPLPPPPSKIFKIVKFPSKVGDLSAYLTTPQTTSKPGPAIIWLTGGFPVSNPGAYLWEATSTSNDQSARIYRSKGIQMMFPHLRGRSGNPGNIEGFYGEVDDVISAYDFLSKQKHIDPKRIYLGGHSTGGTLALLVAASTDKFAGIISLGPVATHYGKDLAIYQWNQKERDLRAPILHLQSITRPTIIAEGESGNYDSLLKLNKANRNPLVKLTPVSSASHFSIIHPFNKMIADAILESKDGKLDLPILKLKSSFQAFRKKEREADDLKTLAKLKAAGIKTTIAQDVHYYAYSRERLAKAAHLIFIKSGFASIESSIAEADDGSTFYIHQFNGRFVPSDTRKLFQASATAEKLCETYELEYDGWDIER